ncbi:hypothetical protein [uncultured Shewanella sp.]|uniref:hypothetical protein n=1 Tax=uncultured Shewanella sp. TaxID=173975 RepID=UPI002632EF83|nr:hypothetical protein [uncultured Shewanella sp.]
MVNFSYNNGVSSLALSSTRINSLINESKEKATALTTWDKIKDFFNGGSKEFALKNLYDIVHKGTGELGEIEKKLTCLDNLKNCCGEAYKDRFSFDVSKNNDIEGGMSLSIKINGDEISNETFDFEDITVNGKSIISHYNNLVHNENEAEFFWEEHVVTFELLQKIFSNETLNKDEFIDSQFANLYNNTLQKNSPIQNSITTLKSIKEHISKFTLNPESNQLPSFKLTSISSYTDTINRNEVNTKAPIPFSHDKEQRAQFRSDCQSYFNMIKQPNQNASFIANKMDALINHMENAKNIRSDGCKLLGNKGLDLLNKIKFETLKFKLEHNISCDEIKSGLNIEKSFSYFNMTEKSFSNGGKSGSYTVKGVDGEKYQYKPTKSGSLDNIAEFVSGHLFTKMITNMSGVDSRLSPELCLVNNPETQTLDLTSKYLKGHGDIDDYATSENRGFQRTSLYNNHVKISFNGNDEETFNIKDQETLKQDLTNNIVLSAFIGDHDINPGNMFVTNDGRVARIDFGHAFNDLTRVNETGVSLQGGGRVDTNNSMLDYFSRDTVRGAKQVTMNGVSSPSKLKKSYEGIVPSWELVMSLIQASELPPLTDSKTDILALVSKLKESPLENKDQLLFLKKSFLKISDRLNNEVASYSTDKLESSPILRQMKNIGSNINGNLDLERIITQSYNMIELSVEAKKQEAKEAAAIMTIQLELSEAIKAGKDISQLKALALNTAKYHSSDGSKVLENLIAGEKLLWPAEPKSQNMTLDEYIEYQITNTVTHIKLYEQFQDLFTPESKNKALNALQNILHPNENKSSMESFIALKECAKQGVENKFTISSTKNGHITFKIDNTSIHSDIFRNVITEIKTKDNEALCFDIVNQSKHYCLEHETDFQNDYLMRYGKKMDMTKINADYSANYTEYFMRNNPQGKMIYELCKSIDFKNNPHLLDQFDSMNEPKEGFIYNINRTYQAIEQSENK